jgi:hypothetical protein
MKMIENYEDTYFMYWQQLPESDGARFYAVVR